MVRVVLAALIAFASPAFAQHVEVTVRPEKAVFLQGEPIYFVAEVKNVSEYPIGYGESGMLRFAGVDRRIFMAGAMSRQVGAERRLRSVLTSANLRTR